LAQTIHKNLELSRLDISLLKSEVAKQLDRKFSPRHPRSQLLGMGFGALGAQNRFEGANKGKPLLVLPNSTKLRR
jgi:hypothetical protein